MILAKKQPCSPTPIAVLAMLACMVVIKAAPPCSNTLTKTHPYTIKIDYSYINISSCSELVKEYTTLCREKTVANQLCCQACQKIKDISCLDDFRKPTSSFTHADLFYNCRKYVRDDPCRCAPASARKDCCVSCKRVDLSQLNCRCRDLLNQDLRPAYVVYVSINYDKHPLVERERVTSNCEAFVKWYPNFCGPSSYHKIHEHLCCKTCKNVDYSCVDNLYWKVTVTKGNKSCQNCNCHDIRKMSKGLMKIACRDNIQGTNLAVGARHACCHQCSRLGYPKPANYVADNKLTGNVHLHFVKSVFEWMLLVG